MMGLLALPALAPQGPGGGTDEPVGGSLEPIISQPDTAATTTGINGSVQPAGTAAPAPLAGLNASTTSATYRIFAIRQQDWNPANPAVPSSRPEGLVGAYKYKWDYDGTTPSYSYHFSVDSRQEGTTFLVVVQKTVTGQPTTYTTKPVVIQRP